MQLQTRDGCHVTIDLAIYSRVVDPERAAVAVEDADGCTRHSCAPICRNALSSARMQDIISRRSTLRNTLTVPFSLLTSLLLHTDL